MDELIGFISHPFAIVDGIGQSLHVLGHARTDRGTSGKEKVCNDDFTLQTVPGHLLTILVGE